MTVSAFLSTTEAETTDEDTTEDGDDLGRSRVADLSTTIAYVEEVRRGLKACKVFLWYPL